MYRIFATALFIAGLYFPVNAYEGKVYLDSNANRKYDIGEKCIPDVCVSDGRNVVKTDNKGCFDLPGHGNERFIFITTPSGYKTFNGYYQRIDESIQSYDFALYPYDSAVSKDGSHSFIHISDTEISDTTGHSIWVGNLRKYIESENIGFIVQTGDICYEAGLKSHIKLMNSVNMGIPIYYCIGNHDLVKGKYGEKLFEDIYGPVWYSFDMGNVHYIVTPMAHGDYAPSYTQEDVYEWLVNDLALQPEGKPVMIFNHDLTIYDENFIFRKDDSEYIDLDKCNLKAWIYGHWHINLIRKHAKAYSVCTSSPSCGGIDHSSSAFRVIHVDKDGDFASELRYPSIDKEIEIASINNMCGIVDDRRRLLLSVNTYHSDSPTKYVRCLYEIDGKVSETTCLDNNTDFNWSSWIQLPENAVGKTVNVIATAEYSNGETSVACEKFVCGASSVSEVDTGGSAWTNLSSNSRHDGHNISDIRNNLSLRWVTNAGSNIYMCSPVISDDVLFIATVDENGENCSYVIAIDVASGKELWKSRVEGSVKNSIALDAGKVFAQDIYGNLYSFSQRDGALLWKRRLSAAPFLPSLIEGLATKDGILYAGTGNGLCAIDADTGREIWRNSGWSQHEGSVMTLSVDDNVVIGGAHWGALYANDARTGRLLWSHSRDGLRNRSSSPSIHGKYLYLISGESFFLIEAETGNIIVRRNLGVDVDVASVPLVTDTEIIFGTADNGVMALEKETYNEKWRFRTGPAMISSAPYTRMTSTVETSPQVSGDMVFFSASDGNLYGIDRFTGKELWRFSSGAPFFSSVSLCGNTLFAADFAGNIYAFVSDPDR